MVVWLFFWKGQGGGGAVDAGIQVSVADAKEESCFAGFEVLEGDFDRELGC